MSLEFNLLPVAYCKIIFIRWTFNFIVFVSKAIQEFKIPTIYIYHLYFL